MAPFLTQEYKLSKALNKISYFMRILSASFVSSIFPGPIAERVGTGLYTRGHLRQPERPRNLKVMYFQRSFQTLDAMCRQNLCTTRKLQINHTEAYYQLKILN